MTPDFPSESSLQLLQAFKRPLVENPGHYVAKRPSAAHFRKTPSIMLYKTLLVADFLHSKRQDWERWRQANGLSTALGTRRVEGNVLCVVLMNACLTSAHARNVPDSSPCSKPQGSRRACQRPERSEQLVTCIQSAHRSKTRDLDCHASCGKSVLNILHLDLDRDMRVLQG